LNFYAKRKNLVVLDTKLNIHELFCCKRYWSGQKAEKVAIRVFSLFFNAHHFFTFSNECHNLSTEAFSQHYPNKLKRYDWH